MSAEMTVRGAVMAALKGDKALMASLNALFDGEPARATIPYGVVGECLGADWGGKDVEGREVRLTIGLYEGSETPDRLAGMIGRVDPAIALVEPVGGWRIVTARLARSRVIRGGGRQPAGWQALIDYRIRAVREA